MVFSVVMYGCESWTIKKGEYRRINVFKLWCWRRLLRVPWTARRSNQSILKEISPGVFFGRTDVEAEAPILWPPDANSWLIGKDPDAGKDWGQEEEMTEDEIVGWHCWLNGHEPEQIPGDREGQGSLTCCSLWGSQRVRYDLLTGQQQLLFCRLGFCFLIYRDTKQINGSRDWEWGMGMRFPLGAMKIF